MHFRSLQRCTRATVRVLFRSFAAFGLFQVFFLGSFVYFLCRGAFVHSLGCWFGFLCIHEALCIHVLVYLKALCAFFLVYNTDLSKKKKINIL
jgi:hypothetical protein